ncbi:hypothetical protein MFMK1_000223 [Metallumcola ferriviriculae]|uniref:Uncharacterized protein n=1 Tax=Metallumcola ferriviriculae TaxID=3039180 RepID=A0AAU0UI68_9FIRM|nr:hypothetical protein MFMK1_000223 [Desulfitibacteraceae bacterium MK1]
MILLSAVMVALMVWLINRQIVNLLGNKAVITAIPFIEELFKSAAAVLLGVPLVALHGIFGIIEGVYDIIAGVRFLPAAASVLSHTFFGGLTNYLLHIFGFWGAWFVAGLVHVAWNVSVMFWFNRRRKKLR